MPDSATPSTAGLSLADVTAPLTILSAGDQTNYNNLVQQLIPATTIHSLSSGATLPTGTIFVADVTSFTATGTLWIESLGTSIAYTGIAAGSPPSFTGCTGGSGTLVTSAAIAQGSPYPTHMRQANLLAYVATFPGVAKLAANQTWTGQNIFNGQVSIADLLVILSGAELEGALGSSIVTFGSVEGKASSSWTFDAGSTVDIATTAHVVSGGGLTVDSGAGVALASGSEFTASTAVFSGANVIAGFGTAVTVDCSLSNTHYYPGAVANAGAFVFTLTNLRDGYRGRIHFLTGPSFVGSPTFDIASAGVTVALTADVGTRVISRWHYWDVAYTTISSTPTLVGTFFGN